MKLIIEAFPDPIYGQNSRVVHVKDKSGCWIIDPGLPPSAVNILNYISRNKLHPLSILLTHAHADHIAGVSEVLKAYPKIQTYLAEVEWGYLTDPQQNLSGFVGFPLIVDVKEITDIFEADELNLEGLSWRVLDTSGHSPGGRTFYCAEEGVAIVGDSLFAGSIGRTDFPHSDGRLLVKNIREKLFTLPGKTRVLSGHGPDTTVDQESRTNPYVGRAGGLEDAFFSIENE